MSSDEYRRDPVWKNAMNFGAIGGGLMAVLRYLLLMSGYDIFRYSVVTFIILLTVIIIGNRYYRDKLLYGWVNYKRGLRSGFLISFFSGVVYGFYVFLEYEFIAPENFPRLLQLQEELIRADMVPFIRMLSKRTGIEDQVANLYQQASPVRYGFSEIFSVTFYGAVFSSLIAIFTRRLNPYRNIDDNFDN